MKKISVVVALLIVVTLVFAACGGGNTGTADTPATDTPQAETPATSDEPVFESGVGAKFVPKEIKDYKDMKLVFDCLDLSNVIWSDLASSFDSTCKENGVQYAMVNSNGDAAKQVSNVENYIQSGYDAIALAAVNVDTINDICGTAQEKGIFTYACGYLFDNAHSRLTQDDYENGYMAGEQAGLWLNEAKADVSKAKICVLSMRNSDILIKREQGILDGLKDACKIEYEVVSTVDAPSKQDGVNAGETVIVAHPDLDAVIAVDSSSVAGFCQSLEAKKIPFGQVGAFGVNGEEESMVLMYEGKYVVATITLGFNTEKGGIMANTMIKALRGEEYNETDWCENTVINRDNVEAMYTRTYPGKNIADAS